MNFCDKCENLYYIKLSDDDDNNLTYYCRKCGNVDDGDVTSLNSICVSKSQKKDSDGSYKHIINKYTKFDPTLPRIYNIKCINEDCITNNKDEIKESKNLDEESKKDLDSIKETGSEIIYLRYDDKNIKFVYICTHCDNVWKSCDNK